MINKSMSKEEALIYLNTLETSLIIQTQDQKNKNTESVIEKDIKALDMAIDALKNKPIIYYLDKDKSLE